ncbi:MAG TPA: RsmE family RNA methyltransferase [Chitinophagaceae bacterium]
MTLPFFYIDKYDAVQHQLVLNEETSRHVIQVLRMKVGEQLNLTDGKGNLINCTIADDHKKHCSVIATTISYQPPATTKNSIAISLLKNTNRFEWFLEKATEIGVSEIIPLICERTEKEKFRYDRLQQICISAMLQSQQVWLPTLHQPIAFEQLFRQEEVANSGNKFIAHCIEGNKTQLTSKKIDSSSVICIGPEGDFTPQEIEMALQQHFIPVSLGDKRLRTETAGVVAATLLCLI